MSIATTHLPQQNQVASVRSQCSIKNNCQKRWGGASMCTPAAAELRQTMSVLSEPHTQQPWPSSAQVILFNVVAVAAAFAAKQLVDGLARFALWKVSVDFSATQPGASFCQAGKQADSRQAAGR